MSIEQSSSNRSSCAGNTKTCLASQNASRRSCRSTNGSSLAELPVAIILFVLFLFLPFVDLVTMALRSATTYAAANNSAHYAAQAHNFLANDKTSSEPSAVNVAIAAAQATKTSLLAGTDFQDKDILVRVIGTPLKAGLPAIEGQDRQPIANVQQNNYQYQIEVTINSQIQPLLVFSPDFFGSIPGLTAPFPLTVTSRQFCEHAGGLGQ